jgi:hypothetical protein
MNPGNVSGILLGILMKKRSTYIDLAREYFCNNPRDRLFALWFGKSRKYLGIQVLIDHRADMIRYCGMFSVPLLEWGNAFSATSVVLVQGIRSTRVRDDRDYCAKCATQIYRLIGEPIASELNLIDVLAMNNVCVASFRQQLRQ